MSRQTFEETLFTALSSGTAVANTTTETILIPNVTIPANYMQADRCLQVTAFGAYGTTSTPTIIFSLRMGGVGGTVIAKSSTTTTTSATGGGASMTAMWSFTALIQCQANGSSGKLMTNGQAVLYNSANATSGTVTNYGLPMPLASGSTGGTTPVQSTVDLTVDEPLSFTVTWGTANAANSIQCTNYIVESMN